MVAGRCHFRKTFGCATPALQTRGVRSDRFFMNPVTLGLVAGAFTTFASLPQIIYIVRMRSMKDISLLTLCMFATGVTLWLVYGIMIRATPVVLWNALSLSLYAVQIGLKLTLSAPGAVARERIRQLSARFSASSEFFPADGATATE
jgi:MtN3 and saliva related transmembrane protein